MTKDFEPIIQKYADEIVRKLILTYDEMGLRASGKFERELETQIYNGTKLVILGSQHSGAMESGIRPSKSKYGPVRAIRQWLDDKKNLPPSMLRDKKSMAFAIAKKIAKEGIKVPNQFNEGEVISKVINEFLAKDVYKMIDELGTIWLRRYSSTITNIFKAA